MCVWVYTCPLAKPQRSREQSWLMLRAETAPKSAPVALVPRQSRRAWLVSGEDDEEDILLLKQQDGLQIKCGWWNEFKIIIKKTNSVLNQTAHWYQNTTHWHQMQSCKLLIAHNQTKQQSMKKRRSAKPKYGQEQWCLPNKKKKNISTSDPSDRDVHTFSCAGIIMSAI